MRSYVFSLCPDSHFAHEQFRNCTVESKNSNFDRQSEDSHFAQNNSGIVPILTLRRTCIHQFLQPLVAYHDGIIALTLILEYRIRVIDNQLTSTF